MYDKTGGSRSLRRAAALMVVAAVATLATACDVVHVHFGSSGGSPTFAQEVALARCMRSHGAPDFPGPSANGTGTAPSPAFLAALRICQHVLPAGVHVSIETHVSVGTNRS
jgi:hypothetical protein